MGLQNPPSTLPLPPAYSIPNPHQPPTQPIPQYPPTYMGKAFSLYISITYKAGIFNLL